jgi:arylsulfatase A-like enzyme
MDRRRFLQLSGLAVAGLSSGAARAAAAPCNVLFLQTDQHHHFVLGCARNPVVRTPNLDRLAAAGTRFTQAVCATPFCSPTRATWVTGQWPHTHGCLSNVDGGAAWLTDERANLPNLLHDAGYACAHFGKWHLGHTDDIRAYRWQGPERERNRGYGVAVAKRVPPESVQDPRVGQAHIAMTPLVAAFHERWKDDPKRSPQDVSIIGRSELPAELQIESWEADRCIGFIEANSDRPFFATYSTSPPHAFWVAPDPYYSMYDPAAMPLPASWLHPVADIYKGSQAWRMAVDLGEEGVREILRCYYAQVTMMDAFIGRILARLDELGLTDRTLIIFTSDHGDLQGSHGCVDKTIPNYYEGVLRVPLIIRAPKGAGTAAPAGGVVDMQVQSVDIMPTILDYTGVKAPQGLHGRSLRGPVEGRVDDPYRPAFCERASGRGGSRMIRSGTWKLGVFFGRDGSLRRELFDLKNDPEETRNLADDPRFSSTIADLEGQLRAHLQDTGDAATLAAWG